MCLIYAVAGDRVRVCLTVAVQVADSRTALAYACMRGLVYRYPGACLV